MTCGDWTQPMCLVSGPARNAALDRQECGPGELCGASTEADSGKDGDKEKDKERDKERDTERDKERDKEKDKERAEELDTGEKSNP